MATASAAVLRQQLSLVHLPVELIDAITKSDYEECFNLARWNRFLNKASERELRQILS